MAIYFFWGDDDFALTQAIQKLQTDTLDPAWASFNFDRITPDQADPVELALNQAMTPPFGMGQRFVWLVDTTIAQRCSEDLLAELERTLPAIPETTTLLLSSHSKPDGRLKSTKLLKKTANVQEFGLIPPWKTDLLHRQAEKIAETYHIQLTAAAFDYLVEAVGNNTRQLHNELEKISLFADGNSQSLDVGTIAPLITTSTQSALQLSSTIRQGNTPVALELVADLLRQNEPALRIVATLIGQFRQRLWIRIMMDAGERDDKIIAQAANIGNPKQLYFLRQELASISTPQLKRAMPLLLDLEYSLKRQGAEEVAALQTKIIELCQLFKPRSTSSK
ncbi:DNA polymerase III subunit delta [filamentous cyanobacterium LEGE 11480]|uniref:DNA polymerase III subunit delta n=1 Tax=Romeriopsis navalis LEGE 11480 TaxID=2777977 RepID=A0A928Z502_9CYAN|nr:DNA polymerase III subunit delta [Romeriopsis navalis]MBE9030948.1 DNA polymerase III subunit delta [Romeriopsis navalis LEGE 11480]